MKVINTENGIVHMKTPTGVGLGNFDGLHIGHMALVNTLINESKLNGLKSIIYTFTRHTENIMRKKLCTPLITTFEMKKELLSRTPLDILYFDQFTEDFSRLDPRSFVKEILVDRLNIKLAVAGFNYHFGYKGQGDTDYLKKLGEEFGFKVVVIPPIKTENTVVSSTSIRRSLENGDMDKVFEMLGRHYSLAGNVISGKKIGRTIGFPTANLMPEEYLALPLKGVYTTKTLFNGKFYPSMTNVGFNPTFEALLKPSVETHLLDFDEDLYNKRIEVFFIERIRGEVKFSSKEELIHQLTNDISKVREFYGLK